MNHQAMARPGEKSFSIDFSQSLTQILASLGHNLNTNSKEGLNVIFSCTDTWKETMTGWHNKQKERIISLEYQLSQVNNVFLEESQTLFVKLQRDFRRLDDTVSRHKAIIPKLQEEVGSTLHQVNWVMSEVDRKMDEFQDWVNYVKPTDMTGEIPMEIVNSLNDVIMNKSPATTIEQVRECVEYLEGEV